MTFEEMILFIILIIGMIGFSNFINRSFFSIHARKIRKATKILKKIQEISLQKNGHARAIGYLRKIDPFVFEELLLTALKKQGLKIRRNKKYTGDGGIDGRCKIEGYDVLIQAKRYKSYINSADVGVFSNLCMNYRCKGLFIHTGKTGSASKKWVSSSFDIVSGSRLIDLLCETPITFFKFYL